MGLVKEIVFVADFGQRFTVIKIFKNGVETHNRSEFFGRSSYCKLPLFVTSC